MGSKGVTEAPVVRPTMEEFCDFEGFLDSVHALGMAHGIVRVVPPKEWADMQPCLFKEGERCETDIDIPTPAQQNVSGQLGVYEVRRIFPLCFFVHTRSQAPPFSAPSAPSSDVLGCRC